MKREQLLEAIGGVDEQFLMETEQAVNHSGKNVRRIFLVAAIIAVLAITAAASTGIISGLRKAEENGSTVANLSTGMGCFVYSDECIYHGVPGYIYQYDTDGKILKTYQLDEQKEIPIYMFATEDAIVYAPSFMGLKVLFKDGSASESVLPDISMTSVYVDGTQLYTTDGGEALTRIDLVNMEKTELLENVNEYYVDDTYIYAVQSDDGNHYFRSPKDTVAFEKIELDFDPNKVVADGEDLYFCQWIDEDDRQGENMRYQVNLVRDGVTTPLPVYSWFYQVLDGCVLYLEEGTYAVKCYDLETGETKLLQENVFEFSVLEERYICLDLFNQAPVILDWETGEYIRLDTD